MLLGQADDENLRQQARRIKADLERLKGVDQVFGSGLRDPELLIRPDPQALAARGLLLSDVSDSVGLWWRDTTGGALDTQVGTWSIDRARDRPADDGLARRVNRASEGHALANDEVLVGGVERLVHVGGLLKMRALSLYRPNPSMRE